MDCPVCGWNNSRENVFCSNCGQDLKATALALSRQPWKLPSERFSFWSQVFRQIGWFSTTTYSAVNKDLLSERVLFCHVFPKYRGCVKKVKIGEKWIKEGAIFGFESSVLVYDFDEEHTFYYEDIETVSHHRNSIYLNLTTGTTWELVLDLPRASLLMITASLFAKPVDRLIIHQGEGEKERSSSELMSIIVQFFVELVATQ